MAGKHGTLMIMERAQAIETEIKIPVADLEVIRRCLRAEGAGQIQPCSRESNTLFDLPDADLAGAGQALRLRSYAGEWLLTFKGTAHYQGRIKQRQELETRVEDGTVLAAILARLGLSPSVRYEKDRELWHLDGIAIALDHTPIGDFVELEGSQERLLPLARRLGLDPEAAIKGSYLSLWDTYRQEHGGGRLPADMTFEHQEDETETGEAAELPGMQSP
jgi:adenylate cyclase class 2